MLADNPSEIEAVISFFRTHRGGELNISISFFEGYLQRERMTVVEAGDLHTPHYRIRLLSLDSHRELELDLDHYSFSSISPDRTEIELTRLLSGGQSFRLTASEIRDSRSKTA